MTEPNNAQYYGTQKKTKQNDNQHNYTLTKNFQHKESKHNDTQCNDIEHDDARHNDTVHNNTRQNKTQQDSFSAAKINTVTKALQLQNKFLSNLQFVILKY